MLRGDGRNQGGARPANDPARAIWLTLGALFTAGGVIGAASLILPHPEGFADEALWTNVALSFAGALVCTVAAPRLPSWCVHLVLLGGTAVITRAVYLSGDPDNYYTFFYVWVGPFAFFYFGRGAGLAHMGAAGIAYAWALMQLSQTTPVATWVMVIGTTTIAGMLVDVLASGVRRVAADSAEIARERAALAVRLEEVARTDDLTGLPNRRAWNEELPREIARAKRSQTPLCVALLDLDRFKHYNDDHGHQAGDRLLKEISASWRRHLRATDVLARYGGEEFALALPACDVDAASLLLERLRDATPGVQTCSAGVARWDGVESPQELVERADVALYEAKAAGRGRIVVS